MAALLDPLRNTLDHLALDPKAREDRRYLVSMLRRLGYSEREIEAVLGWDGDGPRVIEVEYVPPGERPMGAGSFTVVDAWNEPTPQKENVGFSVARDIGDAARGHGWLDADDPALAHGWLPDTVEFQESGAWPEPAWEAEPAAPEAEPAAAEAEEPLAPWPGEQAEAPLQQEEAWAPPEEPEWPAEPAAVEAVEEDPAWPAEPAAGATEEPLQEEAWAPVEQEPETPWSEDETLQWAEVDEAAWTAPEETGEAESAGQAWAPAEDGTPWVEEAPADAWAEEPEASTQWPDDSVQGEWQVVDEEPAEWAAEPAWDPEPEVGEDEAAASWPPADAEPAPEGPADWHTDETYAIKDAPGGAWTPAQGEVFTYEGYTLYTRMVELSTGNEQRIFFFAKNEPKSGQPCALPSGYIVETNERTGLPFLRRDPEAATVGAADLADEPADEPADAAAEDAEQMTCLAVTQSGNRCRNGPRDGSKYCAVHKGWRGPRAA